MIGAALQTRVLPWLKTHRVRLLLLFGGVLLPLGLFGELADEVIEQQSFFFDAPILMFLHRHATPGLNQLMVAFSLLGYTLGVVPVDILAFLLLMQRRRWGDALFWLLAVGGAAVLNLAAKALFQRSRPDLWLSIAPETTFSFPSGHAMGSMALATAVVVLAWPTGWRWFAFLLSGTFAFFVGLSRIYLGVHYPSDIIAGWLAAIAWVIGVSILMYGRLAKPTPQAQPKPEA